MVELHLVPIVGIRSQYMKLAALNQSVELWRSSHADNRRIRLTTINSGQHYNSELAEQYHLEYDIQFDVDLTPFHANRDPDALLGSMISGLSAELRRLDNVDWVVVFGDANTTLAGAIAARQAGLRLVHVESGLRSGNLMEPEERNRVVADHLADQLFVSSRLDEENLRNEGLVNYVFTGDIIRDLVENAQRSSSPQIEPTQALVTLHHEENLQDVTYIPGVLTSLANRGYKITYVAHPRVMPTLDGSDLIRRLLSVGALQITQSTSHSRMLELIQSSRVIITDSGALQREALYLNRRIIVRQDRPFWPAITDTGYHLQIGRTLAALELGVSTLEALDDAEAPLVDDFGDGTAGTKILQHLFSLAEERDPA